MARGMDDEVAAGLFADAPVPVKLIAHYTRHEAHPILAREDCKRSCLSCLVRRNSNVLDSEWYSLD